MKYLLESLVLAAENFPYPFTIVDLQKKDHCLIYVNKEFLKMTGYTKKEVIGFNCRLLQGKNTKKDVSNNIKTCIQNREIAYFDLVNYKKNKEEFINRLLLIPVGISAKNYRYYVGVQLNVTNKNYTKMNIDEKKVRNQFNDIVNFFRSQQLSTFLNKDSVQDKLIDLSNQINQKINSICSALLDDRYLTN